MLSIVGGQLTVQNIINKHGNVLSESVLVINLQHAESLLMAAHTFCVDTLHPGKTPSFVVVEEFCLNCRAQLVSAYSYKFLRPPRAPLSRLPLRP